MQKKAKMIWRLFAICLIVMIVSRIAMEVQELDYEEVQVRVVSAVTKKVTNRRTYNTYNVYEVRVAYKGKVQELRNAHNTYQYTPGRNVKAYLSNGRLFANIEGVATSTPIAKIYFVCLFGSFGLLIAGLLYSGKAKQEKTELK